jgi:hypothetical protein
VKWITGKIPFSCRRALQSQAGRRRMTVVFQFRVSGNQAVRPAGMDPAHSTGTIEERFISELTRK